MGSNNSAKRLVVLLRRWNFLLMIGLYCMQYWVIISTTTARGTREYASCQDETVTSGPWKFRSETPSQAREVVHSRMSKEKGEDLSAPKMPSSAREVVQSRMSKEKGEDLSAPFAIFYNIFIPPKKSRIPVAHEIIKEQVDLMARSVEDYYKYSGKGKKAVTVYYNTVGNPTAVNESFMKQLCKRDGNEQVIDCVHMDHYDSGFEEVTQEKLYEYCVQHPEQRVVYMHSKGSYHHNRWNDPWRRNMGAAVLSDMCLRPPDDRCNVCGLQAQPIWSIIFHGNFFTADCSYVKKLLPPKQFGIRMENITSEIPRSLKGTVFPLTSQELGVGRYASEHWIGTHPSIRPCDLSKSASIRHWVTDRNNTIEEFDFHMLPRHPVNSDWFMLRKGAMEQVMADETRRLGEWFFLGGHVYKWHHLYQGEQFPPDNSWLWKQFPDGERWRTAVAEHGVQAIDVLTAGVADTAQGTS